MLSRVLIIIFSFLVCLNASEEAKYICPLEKEYPDFLSGAITIDQIKNYTDRKVCKDNCINQSVCLLNDKAPEKEEVFSINQEGKLGLPIGTTNDLVKKNSSTGGFNGVELLRSNGSTLFAEMGAKKQKLNFLFPTISNSELVKVGFLATIDQSKKSFDLQYYDQSMRIVANEKEGARTQKGGENIKIQIKKDHLGNVITTKNGVKFKDRALSYNEILAELGVFVSGNTLKLKDLTMCPEEGSGCQMQEVPIIGGKAEYLFENEVQKKQVLKINEASISFITKGLMDSSGAKSYSYQIVINEGGANEEIYNSDLAVTLVRGGDGGSYYCDIRSDLKGDLGENAFSSQEACNKECKASQECLSNSETEGINLGKGCRVVESVLYNPITSKEGETIYMNKKVTTECIVKSKEQVGCDKWETNVVQTPDANHILATQIPHVATNEKNFDFSKAMGVFGTMNALESAGRVFSGEGSACEHGSWFDQPNWGLLAAKYAMAIGGPFIGSGISGSIDAAQKATDVTLEVTNKGFVEGINKFVEGFTKTSEIVKNIAISVGTTVANEVAEAIAKAVEDKDEKQYEANQMANATLGTSSGVNVSDAQVDKNAKDYAQCMTRHGLSYDILANWQMGKEYETEYGSTTGLNKSYEKHALLLEPREVFMLQKTVANMNKDKVEDQDKYFYARYRLENTTVGGKAMILVYSLTAQDKIIAGEVVCGGMEQIAVIRKKYGDRFLDPKYAEPTPEKLVEETLGPPPKPLPDSGDKEDLGDGKEKTSPKDIATSVISAINSATPFPFNLIAMVAMDVLDMVDWGDTCDDLDKAEERGEQEHIKTNKRKSDGLCIHAETEVLYKIGHKPTLEREHYCCYDTQSTKAFAQGLMKQLGLSISKGNCSPITLEHLQKASFDQCKAGQDPQKDRCFPRENFKELQEAYIQGAPIGVTPMIENIINNMFQLKNETEKPKTSQ